MLDYNQLRRFSNGISFKFIQPDDRGLILVTGDHIGIDIDIRNTVLPDAYNYLHDRLSPLCIHTKRMSTFAIGAFINMAVSQLPPHSCYLNVGVWNGFTLFSGMVGNEDKRCIGVDNFSEFGGPKDSFMNNFDRYKSQNHDFFELDYVDYFKNYHEGTIGIYLYDGEHSEENQYKGLKVAEPYFSENAIIIVDDVNKDSVIDGTNRYMLESKHKFNLIAKFNTSHNMHPTFWNGLIVMQLA